MKTLLLVSVAAFVAVASPVYAQSVPEKTGVNSALGIAPKTQDFVTEAAQSDMLEIESSKLALTKTDSSQTKAFAERMVKDHTETSTELKGLSLAPGGEGSVERCAAASAAGYGDAWVWRDRARDDRDRAGWRAGSGRWVG